MTDEYIEKYGRRLWGLCLALCGSVSDAEDLYQETWLRAYTAFARYDERRRFEPWITRICVNLYRDSCRAGKRSPVTDDWRDTEEKQRAMESVAGVRREDYTDLYAAIDRLPDKLRRIVILYYFADMDTGTAAAAEGIPQGTVKTRLSKARKLLKEELGDEYDLQF